MAQEKINPKMALWQSVEETNKDFTKPAELNGQVITTINGLYMIKRATETFGPVGKGWGWEVLVDRYDDGAPLFAGKEVVGREQMHTIQIKLWYVQGGKRNHVTQFGHTPFVYKTSWGIKTDFDAPKKSLTDAIKKCLSLIGFCADIYLGLFEDAAYIEGLELKKRLAEAGDTESVMDEVKAEFKDWLARQLSTFPLIPNERALDLMHKQIVQGARAKALIVNFNPDEIEARINEAFEARKAELNPAQESTGV